MRGTHAPPLAFRRGTLNASSKLVECEALQISLGIQTGKTMSRIFCGRLPPLLASEALRPEGLYEDLSSARASIVCNSHWGFLLGDNRGECMRYFHPSLSVTTKDCSLSLSLSLSLGLAWRTPHPALRQDVLGIGVRKRWTSGGVLQTPLPSRIHGSLAGGMGKTQPAECLALAPACCPPGGER